MANQGRVLQVSFSSFSWTRALHFQGCWGEVVVRNIVPSQLFGILAASSSVTRSGLSCLCKSVFKKQMCMKGCTLLILELLKWCVCIKMKLWKLYIICRAWIVTSSLLVDTLGPKLPYFSACIWFHQINALPAGLSI